MNENGDKAQPHLIFRPDTALVAYRVRDGHACYFRGKTIHDDGTPAVNLYDVEFDDGAILCAHADELHFP